MDLNLGEYLFARNVQIAFRSKLIADGAHVAELEIRRDAEFVVRGISAVTVGPQTLFYGTPLGHDQPVVVRLRGGPARR